MINAVMISCESRFDIRNQTLTNLNDTDWDWDVDIVLDKDCIDPLVFDATSKQKRQTIASYYALKRALCKDSQWIVFMEDDLLFNKYIKHNIINWEPIKNNSLNLGSLYTPRNNSRSALKRGKNWYAANYRKLYGSQFYILSRLATEWIVNHWDDVQGMQDIRITRLARGKPIYYHDPSLVQHMSSPSVWGGIPHQAKNFNPYWRHE